MAINKNEVHISILIGMNYESKKNAHLWQGVKLSQLISIFHLQKCLEIFDKNLADKIQSKNYNYIASCQLGLIHDIYLIEQTQKISDFF